MINDDDDPAITKHDMMIMMTMTVSRKPFMKPNYKSLLGCPCICRVNGSAVGRE